jgi:hypothetical protein
MTKEMDFRDKSDCQENLDRSVELINCGIFSMENLDNVLFRSAFIELMICLRDVLHKLEANGSKLTFKDDIITNNYVNNISELVKAARDSCCHSHSFKKNFFNSRNKSASFLVVYGVGTPLCIDGLALKSEYEDDIAFFFGENRIYFKRHIIRAVDEANIALTSLLRRPPT